MRVAWLSFADGNRPKGEQLLGVCIVEAVGFVEAVMLTHRLEVNPGGEVKGMVADVSNPAVIELLRPALNRLLSRAEAEEIDAKIKELVTS